MNEEMLSKFNAMKDDYNNPFIETVYAKDQTIDKVRAGFAEGKKDDNRWSYHDKTWPW